MILPARTVSLPNFFTPRRCLGLGRGFSLLGRLLCLVIADRDDPEDRVLLPMALLAPVIVPPALLEHGDLVAFRLSNDLGGDGQPVGRLQIAAIAGEQDVA